MTDIWTCGPVVGINTYTYNMDPVSECALAFCEVVLHTVIVAYEENEDNRKECILEMVELALHYSFW